MSSGQTGEYFFHSENGPAYQNNTLGSSSLQKIKGLNIRSFFTQPTDPPSTKIGLQRNYVLSVYGIGRILLVLAYLGGWIAAAIFVRDNNKAKDSSYQGFVSTQIAYLVFGIAGFVIYFIVFFMEAINFMNAFKFFRRLPLQLISILIDIFFLLTTFSVSVACAVRESELTNYTIKIYDIFTIGSLAAAAAFGFIACIILILFIILQAFSGYKSKQPASTNAL